MKIAVLDECEMFRRGIGSVLAESIGRGGQIGVAPFATKAQLLRFLRVETAEVAAIVLSEQFLAVAEEIRVMFRGKTLSFGIVAVLNGVSSYHSMTKPWRFNAIVDRRVDVDEFASVVRGVARGERIMSTFEAEFDRVRKESVQMESMLSAIEMSIVACIMQGCRNGEIGKRHGIAEWAVKNYLRHVYDKMGQDDRVGVALWVHAHPPFAESIGFRPKFAA